MKTGRKPINHTGRVLQSQSLSVAERLGRKIYISTSAVPQSPDVADMDNPVSDRFVSIQRFL